MDNIFTLFIHNAKVHLKAPMQVYSKEYINIHQGLYEEECLELYK